MINLIENKKKYPCFTAYDLVLEDIINIMKKKKQIKGDLFDADLLKKVHDDLSDLDSYLL